MHPTKRELLDRGIDSVTVHEDVCEWTGKPEWQVKGHGEYDDSSVLAGGYRRVHLATFDTLAEALTAYPFAEPVGGLMPTSHVAPAMPTSPPGWFDPADAGEAWGENDY